MSTDARSKTGSADSHTDNAPKSGGIGDAAQEKLTKLTDRTTNHGTKTGAAAGEGAGQTWSGDSLSVDRPEVPPGERTDEPPSRVEAPRYEGPSYRTDADLDELLDRSPEHHAAMITGEFQAGHRYPHNKHHAPV
jgi:hypothetical protein